MAKEPSLDDLMARGLNLSEAIEMANFLLAQPKDELQFWPEIVDKWLVLRNRSPIPKTLH